MSSHTIFQFVQSPVFDIFLQSIFLTIGSECWETEKGLSQKKSYLQKCFSIFIYLSRIDIYKCIIGP